MKKETIIAILLGLLFGGIVAVVISFKSKEIELTKNKIIAPPKEKVVSSNKSKTEFKILELTEPADKAIFSSNTIHLKGIAAKDSLIIIQSPIKDIVVTNNQEKFDLEFPLALGENSIKIVVYPKDRQFRAQEKSIKVYFIDSEL
jgi:hypothetical protein